MQQGANSRTRAYFPREEFFRAFWKTQRPNQRIRGKVIWVLASSRPDLIEVDLKRPGCVDVKIPLFPTTTPREGFDLLQMLLKKRGFVLPESQYSALQTSIPALLTPGSAEALSVKIYREVRTTNASLEDVLHNCLRDYQNPVPPEILNFQISIAASEASDLEFVPKCFASPRRLRKDRSNKISPIRLLLDHLGF